MSTDTQKSTLTPLMRQYFAIKDQYPDTLLLFQVGDFYELFFDDAKQAAAFLGIALTKRGNVNGEPIPLCGVPVHALDYYLVKLIKGGFKVALCDQLEQAVPGKVVERGVTQVLTPGTLVDARLLDDKSASYLCSFFPLHNSWGLLFGELMTAQLFATVLKPEEFKALESELSRFFPDEIVLPHTPQAKKVQTYLKQLGYFTTLNHQTVHDDELAAHVETWITAQFKPDVRESLTQHDSLRLALTTFYSYVQRNQRSALDQFTGIQFYQPDDFLLLDSATQKNLELVKNAHEGSSKNTLFGHLDKAITAMGSRMLKKWLVRPLLKQEAIEQRLDVVQELVIDHQLSIKLQEWLREIGDIERVVGRIALGRAPLSDYCMLAQALEVLPQLKDALSRKHTLVLLQVIVQHIGDFELLYSLLHAALNTDSSKEWLIKPGFDQHLDALRELALHSDEKILELERKEQEITGNSSLKIRYNQVQGYYIELTKLGARSVPDYYIRQQTLASKERFMTPELRILQEEILRAKQDVELVEKQVFERVKSEVSTYVHQLRRLAWGLSHLDALVALSRCAYDYGYVRPTFSTNQDILIEDGRHPVVERLASDGRFIPNSTELSDNARLWIITGPNMGGKSTYLRQVALICIMAQSGSFVPAQSAQLPLLDRIFTRIGAGDNLAEGKSTFLVEMEETALICTQATHRSLVILDEVGRGTSTFDGLAIAQAVVEYIYTHVKARCLFATHYHELTSLQERYAGIKSYYAASKKTAHGIIFLYKIVPGVADGSFGIEVAKLAQLPVPVLTRAQEIVRQLSLATPHVGGVQHKKQGQESLFAAALQIEYEALMEQCQRQKEHIRHLQDQLSLMSSINYDELSPKQAFDILWKIKDNLINSNRK
jgi:DNA mismatch repair protein MutS